MYTHTHTHTQTATIKTTTTIAKSNTLCHFLFIQLPS